MSVISWGKNQLQYTKSTNGVPGSTWENLDTPKSDTTKLTPTEGQDIEAIEEGGGIVDSKSEKTKYVLEFALFVKKGQKLPFRNDGGIVADNYAFRLVPEDQDALGMQLDNTSVKARFDYSTAEGFIYTVTAKVLVPASGDILKFIKGENATVVDIYAEQK